MIYLFVGLAGALGAALRYSLGLLLFGHSFFPFSTLCINLLGCFLLAYLTAGWFRNSKLSRNLKTATGTGFVGSFTTFSTFSVETIALFTEGAVIAGCIYIFISLVGGLSMSLLGQHVQKARII